MVRRLYFVLLSCLYGTCPPQVLTNLVEMDDSDYIPRVVNGYPAALGDVPYQISFKRAVGLSSSTYVSFCGGAIIGPTKILSAAHCFESATPGCCNESITLRSNEVGQHFAVAGTLRNYEEYTCDDPKSGAQWRRLNMVMYPRGYKFPKEDIAIVFLLKRFNFNKNIEPIAYAREFRDYRGYCLVSGFGRISFKEKAISEKLLLARLEVMPLNWCTRKHHRRMDKLLCTSGMLSDVAKGDSGGPLVCSGTGYSQEGPKGILVGIVSGRRVGVGSFFTRVSSFSKYINKNGGFNRSCLMFLINWYVIMSIQFGLYLLYSIFYSLLYWTYTG